MAANTDDVQPNESGVSKHFPGPIVRLLVAIRRSFFVFIMTLGVLWIITGLLIQTGTMAPLFLIWGVSAVIYSALGLLVVRLIGYR